MLADEICDQLNSWRADAKWLFRFVFAKCTQYLEHFVMVFIQTLWFMCHLGPLWDTRISRLLLTTHALKE